MIDPIIVGIGGIFITGAGVILTNIRMKQGMAVALEHRLTKDEGEIKANQVAIKTMPCIVNPDYSHDKGATEQIVLAITKKMADYEETQKAVLGELSKLNGKR